MKKNKTIRMLSTFAFLLSLGFMYTNCSGTGFEVIADGALDSGSTSGPDPFYAYAWHLNNTGQSVFSSSPGLAGNDINVQQTWAAGILGTGIRVQVSDDGLQDTHEDLNGNFPYASISKDYRNGSPYTTTYARPTHIDDDHGTSVAGLIAAVAGNSLGARGVAPKASLSVANILSSQVTATDAMVIDQANGDFDISNMSWGTTQNTIYDQDTTYEAILKSAVTNKRSNKGVIFVKSAGNDYAVECNGSSATCLGSASFDPFNCNPYTVVVGALAADGESASYSSTGPSVWISGMGGETGVGAPAMLTTDRSGCTIGYAKTSASTTVLFDKGQSGNSSCNYTARFNGTSSAAPVVSGVIALMLEANPNLTWRDVKYILAKTATQVDVGTGTINLPGSIGTVPSGYQWEQKWITNAATFKFHNWYGFGRVNADAAVTMAKTYTSTLGAYTETNWANSASPNSAIPDDSAGGTSSTINVGTTLKVEAVQIKASITHADISELALELTSPGTTKSIIINMRNSLTGISNFQNEVFISNAFYQETSFGNWTIKVIDGKAGTTGTLNSWSINFIGAP